MLPDGPKLLHRPQLILACVSRSLSSSHSRVCSLAELLIGPCQVSNKCKSRERKHESNQDAQRPEAEIQHRGGRCLIAFAILLRRRTLRAVCSYTQAHTLEHVCWEELSVWRFAEQYAFVTDDAEACGPTHTSVTPLDLVGFQTLYERP